MASTAVYRASERGPGLFAAMLGLVSFAIICGVGLALGEIEALIASLTVFAAVAVLIDYRIGAVLLIVLLPISASYVFPHTMFGYQGLNPLNVLVFATLGSFVVRGENLRSFLPKPLLWLFVVPIVVAGLLGMRHVQDIPPLFYEQLLVNYTDALGYLRDALMKPMLLVVAALLVGAAVARSQKPERFMAPLIVSVWAMSLLAIVYVVSTGLSLGLLAESSER